MLNKKRLFAGGLLAISINANATGIPTVDVANLVQNVMDYAQQLKSYSEDIYQSQVVANEYVQTLKDWEQTLTEWDSQLEQMKGIADAVDNGEWSKIIGKTELGYPLNPLDPYWDKWDYDKLTEEGVVNIDEDIKKFNMSNRKMADVIADINAIYADKDAELKSIQVQKAEGKREWVSNLGEHTAYHNSVAQPRLATLQEANEVVRGIRESQATGEESQLRTLQTMALQNELLADILTAQLELQTEENQFSNNDMFDRKVAEEKEYSLRIERMRTVHKAEAYIPDNSENAYRSATF